MLACSRTGTEYLRLERAEGRRLEDAVTFADIEAAVDYLNGTEGKILLTTGSKELAAFSRINDFAERAYARVLPMEASIALCRESGLLPSHILAMQGPFSVGMNTAMIRSVNAEYVVTKESGRAGGFEEKALAAKNAGAKLVVIGRPQSAASGHSYTDVLRLLGERFNMRFRQSVTVVGVGAGGRGTLTAEADEAIASAECVIGAQRMLAFARSEQAVHAAIAPDAIANYIREHIEFSRFAVAMSGDTGLFSGTRKLLPLLDFCDVRVLPGISSLSYLCAKLGASYEDVKLVSLHGRGGNIVPAVRRNEKVFALVGGENGAAELIGELARSGLGSVRVSVGERLGYPEEKLTSGSAAELSAKRFDKLSAVLIENPAPESGAFGLQDGAFIRNGAEKPVVPMTKSEVRAVALSKLRLLPDSVAWDVGAGTGSVSVEMALQTTGGRVYAIEKRAEACALIRENAAAFGTKNIEVIEGSAPESCAGLPAPTHAFIGGSSGNMREIIALLLGKNPNVRIVAAAISLETVAELTDCMKRFGFNETEAVCLSVSKARAVGGYNLMTAQNPVYVFTMQVN